MLKLPARYLKFVVILVHLDWQLEKFFRVMIILYITNSRVITNEQHSWYVIDLEYNININEKFMCHRFIIPRVAATYLLCFRRKRFLQAFFGFSRMGFCLLQACTIFVIQTINRKLLKRFNVNSMGAQNL